MIYLSPPDTHKHVEMVRPVLDGHKRFLAAAQVIGRRILGERHVGSISDMSVDFFEGTGAVAEPLHVEIPVGTPLFETSANNDLSLVLFHRGVTNEIARHFGLKKAFLIMGKDQDKAKNPDIDGIDERELEEEDKEPTVVSLLRELRTLDEAHGLTPEYAPIVCDRVSNIVVPGDNYIVGLNISPACKAERALNDQAAETYERLVDEHSRLAQTSSPFQVVIPFARFPINISNEEYQLIFKSLQAEVGKTPVHMHIGEPRPVIY